MPHGGNHFGKDLSVDNNLLIDSLQRDIACRIEPTFVEFVDDSAG